jgi:hypothetical protein
MDSTGGSFDSRQWSQARRAAFIQDALSTFRRRPAHLLSFNQVSRRLHLSHVQYLDLQEVRLDQILGSVERYHDFNRAFLPRQEHLQERWQRIDRLFTSGRSLPPIELYKVGEVYFVRDGNHRVSVARHHARSTIRAYVWEYETDLVLQPDSDIEELLCQAAHAAFLETTQIDCLCPEFQIELTRPDGYQDLLGEIEELQQIIAHIDGRDVPFDEAVTLWSELRYLPIVDSIQRRQVLQQFPGRTETDLYLFLRQNLTELEARYQQPVLVDKAADDLAMRHGRRSFPGPSLRQALGRAAGTVRLRAATWTRRLARRSPRDSAADLGKDQEGGTKGQ